jgi:hypothetical protein
MHSYHIVAELRQIRGAFCPQNVCTDPDSTNESGGKPRLCSGSRQEPDGSYPPLR